MIVLLTSLALSLILGICKLAGWITLTWWAVISPPVLFFAWLISMVVITMHVKLIRDILERLDEED